MPTKLEKRIVVQDNDIKSIARSEKRKLRLEDNGWNLRNTIINRVSGKTVLVYEKYKIRRR